MSSAGPGSEHIVQPAAIEKEPRGSSQSQELGNEPVVGRQAPVPNLHPKFQTYGIGKLLITTSYGSLYPPIDTLAVSLCLFYMGVEYNVGMDITQWILLTYLITSSVAGACVGKFAERMGVDLAFKMAYIGLTVCNILIAIIPSPYAAMILRAFGGVFNSCGVATHAYLQRFLGKPSIITKLMSIQSMTLSLFNIAYPLIVGVINDSGKRGWRLVFVVNAVMALQCVISSFILIPRLPKAKNVKFDPLGILLFFVFIATFNVGMSSITFGWPWYFTLILFLVSAVSLVVFVICEKKVAAPMIPLDFILDRDIIIFFLVVVIVIGVFSSKTMVCPYVFSYAFHFTSLKTSLTLGILFLLMAITSFTLSKIFGKFVSKVMFVLSLMLITIACIIEALGYMFVSIWFVFIAMAFMGIGLGMFYVCIMTGVFRFGAKNITLFAGLNNSFQNIGKSITTSLVSMLLTLLVEALLKNNNYNPEEDVDGKVYGKCYSQAAAILTFIISAITFAVGILSLFMRITDNERGKIGFKESKLEKNRTQQTIMTGVTGDPAMGGNLIDGGMVEVSDGFSDEFLSDF